MTAVRGWTFDATCPRCGGVLEHVADGRPDSTTARAMAACPACDREFVVQVVIADAGRRLKDHRAAERARYHRERQRSAA